LTENHTPEFALRIRMKSLPTGGELEEFNLRHFPIGSIVVVPARLASILVLSGHAELVDATPTRAEAPDVSKPRLPSRK
jgi:hypothetical protein